MKRKFGTILDKDLIKKLKRRAADEERALTAVIEDALARYLSQDPVRGNALEAWERLNRTPIQVTDADLNLVLQADLWEQ